MRKSEKKGPNSKRARCPIFKFFVLTREVIFPKMAPILDPVNFFWVFSLISHCGMTRNSLVRLIVTLWRLTTITAYCITLWCVTLMAFTFSAAKVGYICISLTSCFALSQILAPLETRSPFDQKILNGRRSFEIFISVT